MIRSLRIRDKISLVTWICIFAYTVIGGYYFIERESRLYAENIVHQGKAITGISEVIFTNAMVYMNLTPEKKMAINDCVDHYILDVMKQDPRIAYIAMLDTQGRVLRHSDTWEYGKIYADPMTLNALDASSILTQNGSNDSNKIPDVSYPLRVNKKKTGVCRVGLSLDGLKRQITQMRNRVGLIVELFLLITLVIISAVSKKLTKPLVWLTKLMDRITESGDTGEVDIALNPRRDEIRKLQDSFLWMAKRLRQVNRERLKMMDLSLRAERMATIGILASGVAHEINNPLGGIILCFKNLTETNMKDDERAQHIEVIQSGLRKIQRSVGDLLNFAGRSPMKIEPTAMNDLLEESLKLAGYLLEKRHITIVRRFRSDLPKISIDPYKISQVFLNIIINALQSMGERGTLTLISGMDHKFCWVRVGDTGPGVDPRIKRKIFDSFFTTKRQNKGTGLGLAVSGSFIKQHGGVIEVAAGKSGGAVFIVKLPLTGHENRCYEKYC